MDNSPNKLRIYLPLFLSLALAAGIVLGYLLSGSSGGRFGISLRGFRSYDKLEDVINYIGRNYVDSVDRDKLVEQGISGMLQSLDPHSQYISAEEFAEANDPLQGNFQGVGIQFRIVKDTIYILSTISGGPSEKLGIRSGDKIIYIDNVKVAGNKVTNQEVMKRLKGPKGTRVKVGIFRKPFKDLLNFTITRDVIPTYSIDIAYMVDKALAYVKLSRFSSTTVDEFIKAAKELKNQGMQKLILDLRGNTGGYLQAAIGMADEFLPEGKLIVYTEGRNQPTHYAYATAEGDCEKIPLVILTDEESASASEILAGAIQDNDRGTIVGRRSFGKGLVQEQLDLRDGSAVRLTVARYFTPTGRCIQRSYKNGTGEYNNDFEQRFSDGELEHADSIHFPDSLKFRTPGGKTVYGGGGIMPDVFVPLTRGKGFEYLYKLNSKALIYQFAFDYTDRNREALRAYSTPARFIGGFSVTEALFGEFTKYAAAGGVAPDPEGIRQTGNTIRTLIKAFVGRNILDDKGFYPVYNTTDQTFLKAVEVISSAR